VAFSFFCIPFPLDAPYFILSASSCSYSTSCVGFFSSSTCIVALSYYGVWISSTSMTVGISCVPVCCTPILLRVFRLVLLDAPTLGDYMSMKFRLQTFKSLGGITNSLSLYLPLGFAFYSLENNTLSCFPPFLGLYSGMEK
jgi:hypothetical protein